MSKEKIPELQKLSTADKFAVTVELWDELSSNPDEIPVTEEQLSELDRRLKNIAMIRIESSPGKRRRQESFPVGVNGGCPSSLRRKGPSKAYNRVEEHRPGREHFFLQDVESRLQHLKRFPLMARLY
ncbi:MAG: addiction module protein [Verrucomicrobia bacterium]|nr:addiction module protein [Verrucomicrobiota bacterium]